MKTKKFILHWKSGGTETVEGTSIANAFMNAGYSRGAIMALDYYEEVKE